MTKILLVWEQITAFFSDLTKKISIKLDSMPESKLIFILFLGSIFLILATSQFMEKSGDAVYKWGIMRYYIDFGKWYPILIDHHQGRWAINLPVIASMKLFGTSALVYYIYPFFAGLTGSLLTYSIVSKLSTRLAGVAAFLIFAIFPLIARGNTQLLPMQPAAMFILVAIYFMLSWLDKKKILYILLSGLMVILSYGCKITSLYWALSFVLFLSIYGNDTKCYFSFMRCKIGPAVIVFSLTILCGLIIETLLINYFWDFSYGRLQIISGSHLNNRLEPQFVNFFGWLVSFLRPLSLRGKYFESVPCFFIFLLGVISAVVCLLRGSANKKFLSFNLLFVYLMHCYIVYKFFPFLHPERAHSRSFMIVAIACIIMYCASQTEWNKLIWSRISNIQLVNFLKTALCLAWLITSLIYVGNSWLRNGTILNTISAEAMFSEAKAKQLPILISLEDVPVEGQLSSYDRKNTLRWMVFFGPSKLIPDLRSNALASVIDSRGKKYAVIVNADRLMEKTKQEILVIKEFKISSHKKSFIKISQNLFIK